MNTDWSPGADTATDGSQLVLEKQQQRCFCSLLSELSYFLTDRVDSTDSLQHGGSCIEVCAEAERLLRDASMVLTSTRPPNNFVVNEDGRTVSREDGAHDETAPVFDGSVANATPPHLLVDSSGGSSGGAGSILHLACALDIPLVLAFLLAMGGDARASHTAFRRLMIHEAACNGSVQCLTLLLELGQQYAESEGNDVSSRIRNTRFPFIPRRLDSSQALAPIYTYAAHPELFMRDFDDSMYFDKDASKPKCDFMTLLRLFRDLSRQVQAGTIDELAAARLIMENATLSKQSERSLARSCGFRTNSDSISRRPFPRRGDSAGTSDGHGNTPLHWAAFKNETECVSLLLKFNADPNARAHPSGWTPLHDAAYSNSKETIELLLDAGADVDARANSGATPLCFASQENASDAAALLLSRGADLGARCSAGPGSDDAQLDGPHNRFSGYTPLHYCAHYNAHRAARVLLRHHTARKAMEIPDLSDRLPIHVAVARGSSNVLRELLHAGVKVETRRLLYRSSNGGDREARSRSPTQPRSPPRPETPVRRESSGPRMSTPVSSPLLLSMIPQQPITSSKPWNCLTQRSIDECKELIAQAESHWSAERHMLFTPADRKAVLTVLLVGKHLELEGTGIFLDLWPLILSYCGRGWFDDEESVVDENDSLFDMEDDVDMYVNE
ncbi:hypothetical protein FisN_3Lh465 [Fistulifera solaris]|uniref:Uncharacterized protein n=1 Tax=Fistulifera solaris TaxID=1519565 RepID=A0A1Z5J8D7_FISSO|nr:hypothetical protein FisN_3Lh465 [Fistulifera solaris]|eukprot:GAX10263.1 hypothetical protein FisN_3Lh465 [Fistulifera solaris]